MKVSLVPHPMVLLTNTSMSRKHQRENAFLNKMDALAPEERYHAWYELGIPGQTPSTNIYQAGMRTAQLTCVWEQSIAWVAVVQSWPWPRVSNAPTYPPASHKTRVEPRARQHNQTNSHTNHRMPSSYRSIYNVFHSTHALDIPSFYHTIHNHNRNKRSSTVQSAVSR